MNLFDLAFVVLMATLALMGAIWGVSRIVAGLFGFTVAFFLGLRLSRSGPAWFSGFIANPGWSRLAAFFLVFLGVIAVSAMAGYLLRRFLRAVLLSWLDRLAGAGLGLVAAIVMAAALVVPLTALPPTDRSVLADSVLAPYVLYASDLIRHLVPAELARQYRRNRTALKDAWRRNTRRPEKTN